MRYFAPERPKLGNEEPEIVGAPSQCLPALLITPEENESRWLIRVWLPTRDGRFAHSCHEHITEDIADFLLAWLEDPEAVLKARFNWEPSNLAQAPSSEDVLKGLGL